LFYLRNTNYIRQANEDKAIVFLRAYIELIF
jgi:hypothetical protein